MSARNEYGNQGYANIRPIGGDLRGQKGVASRDPAPVNFCVILRQKRHVPSNRIGSHGWTTLASDSELQLHLGLLAHLRVAGMVPGECRLCSDLTRCINLISVASSAPIATPLARSAT